MTKAGRTTKKEDIETEVSLSECRGIAATVWSDALDACGLEGVMTGITQRSGAVPFVGFAATAKVRTGKRGQFEKTDFGTGKVLDFTAPNEVAVIDMGGVEISFFGGMASLAASRKNIGAVIVDGACRDLDEIRACGLWLASRYVTPRTGSTRVSLESMGKPVKVGGIKVSQGDLVVGDETGIVVVPRKELSRVLAATRQKIAVDAMLEDGIRAGLTFTQAAAKAKYM
jgi:3-hexulose-6-phosphate synthase/6-phospho-3-hexuloisomerase